LAETIQLLNDDDALELFKKTLPSSDSSFIQVMGLEVRARALAIIKNAQTASGPARQNLDFIGLALRGKKVGFEKVIKMIDDLVALLKNEQVDDNNKKEYCGVQFDQADDKKKTLERSVSDSKTAIADAEEGLATLKAEIEAYTQGIIALDKSVAEATQNRKDENSEYKELMSSNSAAKELINVAKNRLQQFYNPKLAKATPSVVLISAHEQGNDAPKAPEGVGEFKAKSEENNGVVAMMDLLVRDLDKEMTEAETSEKDAQADYEQTMQDSKVKRADDSKALGDRKSAKADMEARLEGHTDALNSDETSLHATNKLISSLHGECDWLLQYYGERKEARNGEIDALGKAKAVLSGADYSLLQTTSTRSLRGPA
jgi:chromosome segregation ATPase